MHQHTYASTLTYKKYPYWKLDTEKGLWKSNISCEDSVPVLFKIRVAKSSPWLCCSWQTPRLCSSSSRAALPQWRALTARGQQRPRHRARPQHTGHGPAALQGDPKFPKSPRREDWRLWASICSCTVHSSIAGSELKVKMFLKVTQTVLNTKVRLFWNQEKV